MPAPPRTLFAGLVDDAALYPPGNAPMPRALDEHHAHRNGWYADLVGPFVCPASRIDELLATLPAAQPLAVSLVFDVTGDAAHHALRAVAGDDRLSLTAVEAAHARLGADAEVVGENLRRLPDTVGYLEVPRTGFDDSLDLVAKGGWAAAKYRTGGTNRDAFPVEPELAAFVVACIERELSFKLTAGLHHAVRHTDRTTGLEQHGVLNVLAATALAIDAGTPADVEEVLGQRSAAPLIAQVGRWDEQRSAAVRRAFRSFGCCGVTDPIDDLVSMGLVEEEA